MRQVDELLLLLELRTPLAEFFLVSCGFISLFVLSLLEEERRLGSEFSMSWTICEIQPAGPKFLPTLCKRAVVELVLKRPSARRRSPCDRHASTAAATALLKVSVRYSLWVVRDVFDGILCFLTRNCVCSSMQ
jgi:hypothetical protein